MYIGKVIKCTTGFSVGSKKLTLVQVYFWYHSGWRRKLKPQGLFFPKQIVVIVQYILIRKQNKTIILRNFTKHIWGIFSHNYLLNYLLPLKNICVEVILLLCATVFLICSKIILPFSIPSGRKKHSKAAVLSA